jgi:EAL domain-containing protein (putative c-di-GMP-specific phosphodiesterase class I)
MGLAETTGIVKDIGHHVLNEAGRQLGIWQRAFRPHDPLFVTVNLSSNQFLDADLIEDVKSLLTREGLVRDTLKLEVTESVMMENPGLVSHILERLKQMGVGVACDDFGTGYSSLSNLRRMPFDTLKVDRSFIEADADDAKAALILESIILLAHDLGLAIVAEGIGSQEDVDRLGALACDLGQGYFIGEPMTAKQVVDVLSGVPLTAAQHKTTINSVWERMAGTSNVRVPEPLPDLEPEPKKAHAKDIKPDPKAAKQAGSVAAAVNPPEPAPAVGRHPPGAAPLRPPPERQLIQPGKPAIVLLPPLTPPVFVKHGAGTSKSPAANPPSSSAEHPPMRAAHEPDGIHEKTSDLVQSEPAHAVRPQPGGAPMAPRATDFEEIDDAEESEFSDEGPADANEASDQPEDDAAAQKARALRLGKKLRRKALAKDRPPAEA